jgi:hypothetical protein
MTLIGEKQNPETRRNGGSGERQICRGFAWMKAEKIGRSGHRVIEKSEPKETLELLFFRYPDYRIIR